jgi:cytosine/adenosine deaminase-related metal-dependent hydrolase
MSAYRARYIFPISSPPIADGFLTVEAGRIIEVGSTSSSSDVVDLGNAALLPGLCNAHTHLELSHFERPLGDPSRGFPAWIREVVAWRRERAERLTPEEIAAEDAAAIERGWQESLAAGVTVVADVTNVGAPQIFAPTYIPFREILGLPTNREDALYQQAAEFIAGGDTSPRGISPHAPYTVGVDLLTKLAVLSAEHGFPLAMHLAESPDELELLHSHSGAFLPLLSELSAWDPSAFPRGIRPLEYLKILATAARALVIHGNYLSEGEIDFLAACRDRLTLVYCPRTHAYFGHSRYPLPRLLEKGVNVALGTDSRASNPDLNLWNELRFVADTFPELSLDQILRLATLSGRRALGLPGGELAPGQPADFIVVKLPDGNAADPHELLFDSASEVRH